MSACAIATGITRRSRRYKSAWKTETGTGANSRYAMNFASNVSGMSACCIDQTTTTTAITALRPQMNGHSGVCFEVVEHGCQPKHH